MIIRLRDGKTRFPCAFSGGWGTITGGKRTYAWVILGMVVLTQALFFAGFEQKTVGSRRMVIAAVMTALAVYGALAGAAYSLFMDIWTVLWYNGGISRELYAAAVATALPYTLSYAASNVAFLLLLGRPFGEKLERVKIKYGV